MFFSEDPIAAVCTGYVSDDADFFTNQLLSMCNIEIGSFPPLGAATIGFESFTLMKWILIILKQNTIL